MQLRSAAGTPESAASGAAPAAQPVASGSSSDGGPNSGASSTAGDKGSASSGSKDKDKESKSKSWGWGQTIGVAAGSVSGIIVLYYFWKSGYDVHKTEILLLERFRSLPFYWPPGPGQAYTNSQLEHEGLSSEFVNAFAEWFVVTDLQGSEGVTRDDVLELIVEFGFKDDEKACKDFIHKGEGQLEERRRLSSCGLQESITLLTQLAAAKPAEGEQRPELGEEVVALLRRKAGGIASVLRTATLMQQATLSGMGSGGAVGTAGLPRGSAELETSGARNAEPEEEGEIDESQQRSLEAAQLTRAEEGLIAKLTRQGSLSVAEEARLGDIRQRKMALLGPGM